MDCRSLSLEAVTMPVGISIVVMDTKTPRGLVESAYNERRTECERAAQALGVPALRDVRQANFERQAERLKPVIRRRARHVISENARTLQAVQAMRRGDSTELGRLMDASHVSLRDDYEVSSLTLDTMTEIARRQPGCLGARMTGAGFGGCAIALVRDGQVESFLPAVSRVYEVVTGLTPDLFACHPAGGASLVG
jgi:galactokinase